MSSKYRLHNYWRSSASWRVRIAFALKGIAYEYVAVNIVKDGGEQNRPEYRARNPMTQVPTLEIVEGGVSRYLSQSLPIIEYLEDTVLGGPRLLPADPYLRARVRQLAENINAGIQPFQNLPTFAEIERIGGDKNAWAKKWNERGLMALERLARETNGTFLVGEVPTLADACLVPQMHAARRFGVDTSPYPVLERVEAACLAIAAIDGTRPDKQPDAVAPA